MRTITNSLRRQTSNEDVLNLTQSEVELTIYAKVKNIDVIESLAAERQRIEQWSIPVDSEHGRLRIRKIDDLQMLLTSKTFRPGVFGCLEHTTGIIKAQYENIRKMGEDGHFKTRLVIPFVSHPYRWEVDLYFTSGGSFSQWVKIDLEGFDINKEVPEELPFDCEYIILSDDPNITEGDKRQIEELWEKEWAKIPK